MPTRDGVTEATRPNERDDADARGAPEERRRALVAGLRAEMARLQATLGDLPVAERESEVLDGWTAKEVVMHVAAWDRELVRGVREFLAGAKPSLVDYDVDEFNAGATAATGPIAFEDALAEMRAAHEDLVATIEALDATEWDVPSRHEWREGEPITLASMFDYEYKGGTHYGGHETELRPLLPTASAGDTGQGSVPGG